ncbi:hypothetical protein, partial [uncultured Oscillibacter sp.]|uniref:hypothetical protein n=1 Tax=uncultured Oscillibacter sp. TaxID=876091 RepID=UPI002616A5D3
LLFHIVYTFNQPQKFLCFGVFLQFHIGVDTHGSPLLSVSGHEKTPQTFLNLRRWPGRRNGRCLADIARFLCCCSLVCAAPFSAALKKH